MWQRWLLAHAPLRRPQAGDEGLDRTHTWGRTYWGGTLFWLMVDLQLRLATDGRSSIRDVVVAIAGAGGNGRARAGSRRRCASIDAATGTTLVSTLYRQLARPRRRRPRRVAVAARRGPGSGRRGRVFDDGAPLSAVRRALVRA
ncbi:MAG: hypothetical protein U0168_25035 [Nannocystaceae bacterium]